MRVELRWPLESLGSARALVLDTNMVLDLLVFSDPATALLRELLHAKTLRWVATAAMREELVRVLGYPKIAARVAFYDLTPASVLQAFDAQTQTLPVPPRIPATCRDADDQKFLDLAVAERAVLLSKDKAVIALRKRLLAYGTHVGSALV
ncbi:putative toxin-antitoxin system toxin component, PIN family [Simplicispira psychrophila]|uniref:putative toxin-antitoxin system toxin component, PIN family n=1 Tax=Simplicispira psychrophila TaxID=80882 RepID=UPI000487F5DD|nr:putative toxin-antitoxin system toxin component, PIN family [Simplicispira psychrophila]